jgi:hypothetical protein
MYLNAMGVSARPREDDVRRREPRYLASMPVGLQRFLRFGPLLTRGITLDISMRGMSALVCGAPRVGETVALELALRGVPVEMLATVRHSARARSGFEFFPLTSMAENGIQDWIEELGKEEEKMFPFPYAPVGRG